LSFESASTDLRFINMPVKQDLKSAPTAEQLRHDIDRGLTGDKAPASDPAAAPLGADDEAAETPPSPSRIARTILQETSRSHVHRDPAAGAAWILIAAASGMLAIIVLVWAFTHQSAS
jgi:hypothetical protein